MAKSFGSGAEVKSYIIMHMKPAVKAVQDKIHDIIEGYLYAFYGEYQPKYSQRTWQVFDSLVKTAVVREGNGWVGEVYFDISALSHPTSYYNNGFLVQRHWTEEKILGNVMTSGTHGGRGVGIPVWDESMESINPAWIDWLKKELIANGIPVR